MSETPRPLTDASHIAFMQRRRARLSHEFFQSPHPSLVHAVALAQARLVDMRLPDGPRLLIDPLGAGNPDIFSGLVSATRPSRPAGGRSAGGAASLPAFRIADALPRPDDSERPVLPPAADGVLRRLLAGLRWPAGRSRAPGYQASPLIVPNAAGRFEELGDGSQAVVLDFGGLLVGRTPSDWFKEMARILCPEGLYLCVSPGPTTLAELWAAWGRPLPVSPLWHDLHDLGDALASAGLAAPVAESEMLVLTYNKQQTALKDLRSFPLRPVPDAASAGVMASQACHRLRAALEGLRKPDGRIALHLECVLTHAWKPAPRPLPKQGATPAQPVPVQWHPSRPG